MKVGIQLYTVRNMMAKDPLETLEELSKIGYKYLEVANHNALEDDGVGFGVSAEELNKIIKKNGQKIVSAHILPFNKENYKRVIEYNQKIGNFNLVFPLQMYSSHDEVLKTAEFCEEMGTIATNEGMNFLYHNHYHEFQELEGEVIFDTLLKNTDPKHVKLELDTFWTMRGNQDLFKVMEKFRDRIKLIHLKDYSKTPFYPMNMLDVVGQNTNITFDVFKSHVKQQDFTEIGYGVIDIQKIIDTAKDFGTIEYAFLEQDESSLSEKDSIIKSMNQIKLLKNIECL